MVMFCACIHVPSTATGILLRVHIVTEDCLLAVTAHISYTMSYEPQLTRLVTISLFWVNPTIACMQSRSGSSCRQCFHIEIEVCQVCEAHYFLCK